MKRIDPANPQSGLNTSLHIGKIIEAELRAQERSVTWFARQLHCDRRNVYDIFDRVSIDTQLLMRISCILGRDFFKIVSDSLINLDNQTFTSPETSETGETASHR